MNSFHVLDRNQNIHQNYLLQASAGTGKTFSIENLAVRLLIEGEALSVDQILIVTFTKAATRDLRVRIHLCITKSIQILSAACAGRNFENVQIPDYLQNVIDHGLEAIQRALRHLERAISVFDSSQIYTIHSFCARMLSDNALEANYRISLKEGSEVPQGKMLRNVIRDYFRSGKVTQNFSRNQLKLVLKEHCGDLESLEKSISDIVLKGIEIVQLPTFEELLKQFNAAMHILKTEHHFTSEKILEDIHAKAPNYKVHDIKRNIRAPILERVHFFASLFDKNVWSATDLDALIENQLSVLEDFGEDNRKSKSPLKEPLSLHFPEFNQIIKQHLLHHVCINSVFARICFDCQKLVYRSKMDDQIFNYDDFLVCMREALDNPTFKSHLQSKYKAAIIDEFQDTDPLQWDIFQKLFLSDPSSGSLLYLVGDPKQSIYAFRQADIYTYMHAAEKLGKEAHYSLDTNFRSQPSLVEALNILFCSQSCPGLLYLPKLRSYLEYPWVNASQKNPEKLFCDNKGAVHFFIAEDVKEKGYLQEYFENEFFLPFIVQEIQQLVENDGFLFSSFAILVSDRYQGSRTRDFLQSWNIPVSLQKATNLADSPAVLSMRELLAAVLNPNDLSLLKISLGGKIIRWDQKKIKTLEDPVVLEHVLYKLFSLRHILLEKGISTFFSELLQCEWKDDSMSVYERFLAEEDSEEFLQDLFHVADYLFEAESSNRWSPDRLIHCLEQLDSLEEEDQLKKRDDPAKNAVRVMTTHVSKGLEFDIVFTLGFLKRMKIKPKLIPTTIEGKQVLSPLVDFESEFYANYCQEQDAEKIRQLYVGMTRAKFRLYVPVLSSSKSKRLELGSASPMDLYLARLGQEAIEQSEIYGRIENYHIGILKQFINSLQENISITYSSFPETPVCLKKMQRKEHASIVKPPEIVIPGVNRFIQSFTTLSSSMGRHHRPIALVPPKDFHALEKTPHTLPSGSDTGNLLHKCLEKMVFEKFKLICSPEQLLDFVTPFVLNTEFEEWISVICSMLFNAIKVPLDGYFSLCDVSTQNYTKEAEFLYPSFLAQAPGYFKGFIDLFFEHQGKYYLLDWKSNWLGPDVLHYGKQEIQVSMEEHGYFLQAKLYAEAIKKYLKVVDERPFEEIFGGIYYVYLRGLEINSKSKCGIFYFNP